MKNMLVNDLNNLNITSAELNEEIRVANEDFGLFFKSMFDRQSLLFARTIALEEKYGYIKLLMLKYSEFHYNDTITKFQM